MGECAIDLNAVRERFLVLDGVSDVKVVRWDSNTGKTVIEVTTTVKEDTYTARQAVYDREADIIVDNPGAVFDFHTRREALHTNDGSGTGGGEHG